MSRVTPQYVSDQMPLDFAELQNCREVCTFFALPPGDFVVLPYSVQHREGKFLLRILADQHADVWEVNEDNLVVHNIAAEFGDERSVDCVCLKWVEKQFHILIVYFDCSVYFIDFEQDIRPKSMQLNFNKS